MFFSMLLTLADSQNPDYAEALRKMWIERAVSYDLEHRALQELTNRGDFKSLALRNHLIACDLRARKFASMQCMASNFYRRIEAGKVLGETEFEPFYEDSLKELSWIIRDPSAHPLVFDYYHKEQGVMFFSLRLRRLEISPDTIDFRVRFKIEDDGLICSPEVSSGIDFLGKPAASDDKVYRAINKALEIPRSSCDVLKIGHFGITLKDKAIIKESRWQLKVLQDLRKLFWFIQV